MKTNCLLPVFLTLSFFVSTVKGQDTLTSLKKEKFNLSKVSEDKTGYAQAVKVGNTIYVSGSTGYGNMKDALKMAYDDILKTLKNYNASFRNVVKENLYTTALDSVIRYKDVRLAYYDTDFPAATWVEIKRLYSSKEIVEVEVIALLNDE